MTEHNLSPQEGTIWFAVLIIESVAIVTINAITLVAFAKHRRLRSRSTYLIINLTVADLLVGAVTGPLSISHLSKIPEIAETKYTFSWGAFILWTLSNIFPIAAQVNLSLIALERLHATVYPFRHCEIGSEAYFKVITGTWLIAVPLALAMSYVQLYELTASI